MIAELRGWSVVELLTNSKLRAKLTVDKLGWLKTRTWQTRSHCLVAREGKQLRLVEFCLCRVITVLRLGTLHQLLALARLSLHRHRTTTIRLMHRMLGATFDSRHSSKELRTIGSRCRSLESLLVFSWLPVSLSK